MHGLILTMPSHAWAHLANVIACRGSLRRSGQHSGMSKDSKESKETMVKKIGIM